MAQGEQAYFETFGGYELPLKLQAPISRDEADRKQTYYVARYDSSGRVVEVRKLHDSETFFLHEYTYDDKGVLVAAKITNRAGEVSVLERSADGTLMKKR